MGFTDDLRTMFEEAAEGLARVRPRRMFGCDAFFVAAKPKDEIFGLIWKEGRIAIKLAAPEYQELLDQAGARPWTIGAKKMSGWVFVPEAWHDDPGALAEWVQRAHRAATTKPAQKPAKRPAKQPAKAKKPAKVKRPRPRAR